jgi:hypothetical protein
MLHALKNRFFREYPADRLRPIVRAANGATKPLVSIPSMISPSEQDLLRRLARDYYSGTGLVIDAGVFLGASTNVFAVGLRERPDVDRLRQPVQSYDLGVCDEIMAERINDHYQVRLKAGDSFLPYLRENIFGVLDLVPSQRRRHLPVFARRRLRDHFSRRLQNCGGEPSHGSNLLSASNS